MTSDNDGRAAWPPGGRPPLGEGPLDLHPRDRLHQVLDRTIAFGALLTPEGVLTEVSQNALLAAGIGLEDVQGRPFWECYWWSHDAAAQERVRRDVEAARRGETSRYDTEARIVDDGRLQIAYQLAPITDSRGRVVELVASAYDITDRVASQTRLEELMHEMSHRVKNILATVRAMARMTKLSSPPETAFADFLARLEALDAAHDALGESASASEFFAHLARRLLAPYSHEGQAGEASANAPVERRIVVSGPAVRLARDEGKLLALCIHELATNAAKYGALSADSGRVEMALTARGPDGRASFVWRETGGPAVVPPSREGYGTRLLTTTLESLFGAPVEVVYAPEGFSLRVAGPADALFA